MYVAAGLHKSVFAVSAVSGAVLWNATVSAAVFSTPVVASGRLLVSDWSYGPGHVYMFATR